VQRSRGQFDEHVVREQQASWPPHGREIGQRQRLFEDAVIDEDVSRDDQIEAFFVTRRREPFQHDVQVADVEGGHHFLADACDAHVDARWRRQ